MCGDGIGLVNAIRANGNLADIDEEAVIGNAYTAIKTTAKLREVRHAIECLLINEGQNCEIVSFQKTALDS